MLTEQFSYTKNKVAQGVLLACFVMGPTAGTLAYAEEAKEAATIEKIIVTARKREESLQEIPIAATAFSTDDLNALGATNITDIAYSVPNLSLQDRGGSFGTSYGIRGISSNVRNAGIEDSVGLYVDGVYVGRPQFFRLDTADISQIEVLRGPQGSLFGKNTVAGALNVTTIKPNSDYFEGSLQAKIANFGTTRLAGYLSGPISDSVAGKLTFTKNDSDGWIKNGFNGETLQGVDDVSVRGQLAIQPSDQLSITLSADYTDVDNNTVFGQPFVGAVVASPEQIGDQLDDHQKVFRNGPVYDKSETSGVSVVVDYDMDTDYTLSLVAAARNMDFDVGFDDDNSSRDFANSIFQDSAEQWSVEARLASPSWDTWDFVVGALYYEQEVTSKRRTGPLVDDGGPPVLGLITGDGSVDTTSLGLFFHSNIHLTESLDLSVGARWTDDEKEGEWGQTTFDPVADLGLIPPDVSVPRVKRGWDELTPSVALTYSVDDDTIVYSKYSSGFKSGSMLPDIINLLDPDTGLQNVDNFVLDAETVDNFEIGYKTTALKDTLRLNAAIFYMDYQNLQVINLSENSGGGFIGGNGDADFTGAELEITWLASDNLTLSLTGGYIDAEYTRLERAGNDLSGNTPRNAPGETGSLQAWYALPLNAGILDVIGTYSYRGSVFYDPENSAAIGQDSYALANVRIGYTSNDDWSVFLWGKNLFDEKYATFGRNGAFGQQQHSYGTPRTYGIEVNYSF